MWKIVNKHGQVLVDVIRKMKPIDTNSAVIGIYSREQQISLFGTEEEAHQVMKDKGLIDCFIMKHNS